MGDPKSKGKKIRPQGRMIRVDISEDEGLARLSDGAARLYFYLTPHQSSYGKFTGGPHMIKETVVPHLPWSSKRILRYLGEINTHTSYRVWKQKGRFYLQDLTFFEKQDIRPDRRGEDRLPDYPGQERMKSDGFGDSIPEVLPDQVPDQSQREVEVEVEDQREEEGEVELSPSCALPLPPSGGGGAADPQDRGNGKGESGNGEISESKMALILKVESEDHREALKAILGDVLRGSLSSRDAISYAVNMRCLNRQEAELLFTIDGG